MRRRQKGGSACIVDRLPVRRGNTESKMTPRCQAGMAGEKGTSFTEGGKSC